MIHVRSRSHGLRLALAAVVALLVASGAGADSHGAAALNADTRLVSGETVLVGGRSVSTWAWLDADDSPVEAGVSISYAILSDPPDGLGSGPAGAIAVADFPREVQASSILNHFEMHWEAHGHTPAPFEVPHFDLHFYGIPSWQVAGIGSSDTAAPAASRVPAGYVYGGPDAFVPQMGAHALNPADLQKPFEAVLILGYYEGNMIFVEPMVTRRFFETKRDFSFAIPMPAEAGAQTLYPTRVDGRYEWATDTYQLTFSGFRRTES